MSCRRCLAAGFRLGAAVQRALVALTVLAGLTPSGLEAQAGGRVRLVELPGLRANVATLIVQGAAGGDLPLAVVPQIVRAGSGGAGDANLEVVVEIPGSRLAEAVTATGENRLTVELYLYALTETGAVAAHRAHAVAVALDRWGEVLTETGLRWAPEIRVPPGTISIRVLATVRGSDRFGLVVTPVEISAAGAAGLGRPAPVAHCPAWLELVAEPESETGNRAGRPLWISGERTSIAWPVPPGAPWAPEAAGFEVRFATLEDIVSTAELGDVARTSDGGSWTGAFVVPELPSGAYRLSIASRREGVESPPLEVWVLAAAGELPERVRAAGPERACGWPQVLNALTAVAAGPVGGTPPAGPVRSGGTEAIRSGYRTVLAGLGRAERDALAALLELEESSVAEDPSRVQSLFDSELAVARELIAADVETALPLVRFHTLAYEEHYRRGQYALAGHSRRAATAMFDAWIEHETRDEGRRLLAAGMAGLAAVADRHRMFAAAGALLERAVEVDPETRSGRLLASMLYEKLGEYESARDHLAALVQSSPALPEGWLRLGLARLRLGEAAAGRRALRRVLDLRPVAWPHAVAFEALAMHSFARARHGEGVRLLQEGRWLLPEEPTLELALAYGLDRLGRTREASRLLARSADASRSEVHSPRYLYTESASALAARVDRRLDRAARVRTARLGAALAELEAGGAKRGKRKKRSDRAKRSKRQERKGGRR